MQRETLNISKKYIKQNISYLTSFGISLMRLSSLQQHGHRPKILLVHIPEEFNTPSAFNSYCLL